MIGFVRGRLAERKQGLALVDVGGVGYALQVSDATLAALPAPGSEVTLLTILHVREDAMQLFGFRTEDERALFERLRSVTGVGPKLALAILSALPVGVVLRTIAEAQPRPLTAVSGVGKRLAERIVVELKDRLAPPVPSARGDAGADGSAIDGPREEAVAALVALGVRRAEALDLAIAAQRELGDVPGVTPEDLVRHSLSALRSHS